MWLNLSESISLSRSLYTSKTKFCFVAGPNLSCNIYIHPKYCVLSYKQTCSQMQWSDWSDLFIQKRSNLFQKNKHTANFSRLLWVAGLRTGENIFNVRNIGTDFKPQGLKTQYLKNLELFVLKRCRNWNWSVIYSLICVTKQSFLYKIFLNKWVALQATWLRFIPYTEGIFAFFAFFAFCLYFFLTPNYQLSNKVKQRNKEKTHKRIPFKRKLIPHFLNASHP